MTTQTTPNQYRHENVTLHFQEIEPHPVYGRAFTTWFDKCQNLFHLRYGPLTSSQAIAYKVAAEKRAWELNHLPHLDGLTHAPIASTIKLNVEIHPL